MAVATEPSSETPKSQPSDDDVPPKVPPRTKRRSKTTAEVKDAKPNPDREVLVATSRGTRERKAESRQRQPPSMLVRQASELGVEERHEEVPVQQKTRKGPHLLVLPANKGPRWYNLPHAHPPMRMVPVPPMSVSYANWIRKVGPGDPEINSNILRRILANHVVLRPVKASNNRGAYPVKSVGSPVPNNNKSVTRSGSLSSQGSTGSDSGNESRPKSVLKKVRGGSCEPKKVVTFNALTTVQVMEE